MNRFRKFFIKAAIAGSCIMFAAAGCVMQSAGTDDSGPEKVLQKLTGNLDCGGSSLELADCRALQAHLARIGSAFVYGILSSTGGDDQLQQECARDLAGAELFLRSLGMDRIQGLGSSSKAIGGTPFYRLKSVLYAPGMNKGNLFQAMGDRKGNWRNFLDTLPGNTIFAAGFEFYPERFFAGLQDPALRTDLPASWKNGFIPALAGTGGEYRIMIADCTPPGQTGVPLPDILPDLQFCIDIPDAECSVFNALRDFFRKHAVELEEEDLGPDVPGLIDFFAARQLAGIPGWDVEMLHCKDGRSRFFLGRGGSAFFPNKRTALLKNTPAFQSLREGLAEKANAVVYCNFNSRSLPLKLADAAGGIGETDDPDLIPPLLGMIQKDADCLAFTGKSTADWTQIKFLSLAAFPGGALLKLANAVVSDKAAGLAQSRQTAMNAARLKTYWDQWKKFPAGRIPRPHFGKALWFDLPKFRKMDAELTGKLPLVIVFFAEPDHAAPMALLRDGTVEMAGDASTDNFRKAAGQLHARYYYEEELFQELFSTAEAVDKTHKRIKKNEKNQR